MGLCRARAAVCHNRHARRSISHACVACYTRRALPAFPRVLTATLFIPDLLRPDEEDPAAPASRFAALERLLARASLTQFECESSAAWMCHRFSVPRQADWPVASISLFGSGRAPGRDYWLCAEPAHLRVHGDKLLLAPSDTAELSTEESLALVQALNAHFARDGFEFVATDAQHWYLRAPVCSGPADRGSRTCCGQRYRSLDPGRR